MFLLAGGPPREVMTGAIQTISNVLPRTHVIGGMCMSWLGSTDEALWWPVLVAALAVVVVVAVRSMRRAKRDPQSTETHLHRAAIFDDASCDVAGRPGGPGRVRGACTMTTTVVEARTLFPSTARGACQPFHLS
jgi:hypothetical protein